MLKQLPLALSALVLSGCCLGRAPMVEPAPAAPAAPASAPVAPERIAIGAGETDPHTHLAFKMPKGARIVRVDTRLTVEKVAPKGLNFFAIQVNYPNKTWAHGGPQYVDGGREQANWGGLVNRGGGSKDYKEVDWSKDLALIECGIGKPNTVPWQWRRGVEYVLTVERGARVVLPAGVNASHGGVTVPERPMWEWKFSCAPADGSHAPFTSLIYDSADHIQSFYLWNESGYGSTDKEQRALWSMPTYRVEGSSADVVPTGWRRF